MKLKSYRLYQASLTCKKPFRIATTTADVCRLLVLELIGQDGELGWGESVPHARLTGETLEGAASCITDRLLPALAGQDLWQRRAIARRLHRVAVCPSARAAVDLAIHDMLGRTVGLPLAHLLGGPLVPVKTDYSIGITTPREAAEDARRLIEQGWSCIKLKVGTDPQEDVARVRAVRGAIGPEMTLRIDANEGWSFTQASRALHAMEPYGLELAEQPLVRWDLAGLARLRSRTTIPIALDESVHSAQDALRALQAEAGDIINLKLMKCGGLSPGLDIVAIARAFGAEMMVGGMVGESALAVTAATSLAGAMGFEYADLDADLLVEDTLTGGGAALEREYRVPPDRPGLGVNQLNREAMKLLAEGTC